MEKEERWIGLNRDVIKYIAMLTMFLNHFAHLFLEEGTVLYETFIDIGFFTAITMCYFLVEGYEYTRSKANYGKRLFIFAIISQIPYSIAFHTAGLNMLFSLLICFLILYVKDTQKDPKKCSIYVAILVSISSFCDWPILAAIFTILFSEAKKDREKIKRAYMKAIALDFLFMYFFANKDAYSIGEAMLHTLFSSLALCVSAIVILYLYNGQKSKRAKKFSKWFFYCFYPGHITLLIVLKYLLK